MKKILILMAAMLLVMGISIAEENTPRAIIRGNTAVVAIPHEWLNDYCSRIYKPNERLVSFQSYAYYAEESWLKENLDADEYLSFMADYTSDGNAYYLDLDMDVFCDAEFSSTNRFKMSKRYLNDTWYLVFRQEDMNFNLACEYAATQIFGSNKIELIEQAADTLPESEIYRRQFNGNPVYEIGVGNLKISIFQELGTNIAVVTERAPDKNRISKVGLHIGKFEAIEVSGYMDGDSAIYCCVLSDEEVEQLQNHIGAWIQRDPLGMNFKGTPWALVKSGEFYGIVDQNGTFILDAEYTNIKRTPVDGVFVAQAQNNSFEIFDARKNKLIASIPHDGGWGSSVSVENEVFFVVTLVEEGLLSLRSMEDGRTLTEFDLYSEDFSLIQVDGDYRLGEDSTVNCFVGLKNSSIPRYYVCNLQGKVLTDSYRMLIPLKWKDGTGSFLAIKNDSANTFASWENSKDITLECLIHDTFNLEQFGENACCGIVDESGNEIINIQFTHVYSLENGDLCFSDASGEITKLYSFT